MRRNNMRVIQINGFRGIVFALFIVSCLIAGFVAFPALLSMCLWNALSERVSSVPSISFVGGLLLWGILAVSFMILNKRRFIVSLNAPQELSEEELKKVLSKIQTPDFSNIEKDLKDLKDIKDFSELHGNNKSSETPKDSEDINVNK